MLESTRVGTLNPKDATESVQQALKLIGNALTHVSSEQRRRTSTCLNKELSTLLRMKIHLKMLFPSYLAPPFSKG